MVDRSSHSAEAEQPSVAEDSEAFLSWSSFFHTKNRIGNKLGIKNQLEFQENIHIITQKQKTTKLPTGTMDDDAGTDLPFHRQ